MSQNPSEIKVNGVLAPDTDYYWEVVDQFGNIYTLPFTTDEDGIGTLLGTQLPDGFFNAGMRAFDIRVKTDLQSCDYVAMAFVNKYDRLCIEVHNSNIDKKYVGCPIDVQLPARFSSERFQFLGVADQMQFPLDSASNAATIKDKLKNSKQVLVFNETGVLRASASLETLAEDEYYYDKDAGIIYFGQTVVDQEISIISFK